MHRTLKLNSMKTNNSIKIEEKIKVRKSLSRRLIKDGISMKIYRERLRTEANLWLKTTRSLVTSIF